MNGNTTEEWKKLGGNLTTREGSWQDKFVYGVLDVSFSKCLSEFRYELTPRDVFVFSQRVCYFVTGLHCSIIMLRMLIFPFGQRKLGMTSRRLLVILLWWFVLGCRANWDSDDDPGKQGNHGHVNSVLLMANNRIQILSST